MISNRSLFPFAPFSCGTEKSRRLIIPPWWHTCVQGENANEDELFMPREELSLSAIVEKKEWCLIERSEIRQSFWTEIKERESFPRQGKCPSGQFLSLDTCMSSSGDSFFSFIRDCSNHKFTDLIIAQCSTHVKISCRSLFTCTWVRARAHAQAQIFKTILYVIYIARSIYT